MAVASAAHPLEDELCGLPFVLVRHKTCPQALNSLLAYACRATLRHERHESDDPVHVAPHRQEGPHLSARANTVTAKKKGHLNTQRALRIAREVCEQWQRRCGARAAPDHETAEVLKRLGLRGAPHDLHRLLRQLEAADASCIYTKRKSARRMEMQSWDDMERARR